MIIETRSSDPLQHYSHSSMFYHTFKGAPPLANHSDDFNPVHNFVKIMGSKNADKLFDDAEAIVSSKFAPTGASENNDEDVTKCNRNLEERRPGLGLKRAQFSLKPDKGMPSVSLEPTLDIDKLQDPEEFFSAYYKLEYAKEIIERQAGGNTTRQHEYNPSASQRRRRPSLFGRRASYKHKYSTAILENDDTVMASEDTSQQENHSPLKYVSQEHDVEMQERELGGSVSNSENATNGLLDELLSRDIENLDGDGALSMLQEHLQIKPVVLDEYLFDPSEVGNIDLIDLEEEMPVSRKALSDIQNVVSGISEKNPVNHEQVTKNKNHASTSSTPSERPSTESSISEKDKSSSKPFHLPFSATDPDLSVAESRTRKYLNGQSDNLFKSNVTSFSGRLKSRVEDEAKKPACAASGSKQVMPGDSCSEKSANFNTIRKDIHSRTRDSHDGLVGMNECNNVGEILHEAVSSAQPVIGNDVLSRGTAVQAHGSSQLENNVDNIQQIASSTQPDANIDDSTIKNFKISQSHQELFVAEDHIMDGHTTNAESSLKQQNEKHPEIPLKDGRKAGRAQQLKKRKSLSRRQSLAAAGTCWKSGVRRSNRIKLRPLEYWKGERFLFGRVHESLTTVIGVKCISSPSPGGKEPKFRVISYVSDEHKDRVDLAALH